MANRIDIPISMTPASERIAAFACENYPNPGYEMRCEKKDGEIAFFLIFTGDLRYSRQVEIGSEAAWYLRGISIGYQGCRKGKV